MFGQIMRLTKCHYWLQSITSTCPDSLEIIIINYGCRSMLKLVAIDTKLCTHTHSLDLGLKGRNHARNRVKSEILVYNATYNIPMLRSVEISIVTHATMAVRKVHLVDHLFEARNTNVRMTLLEAKCPSAASPPTSQNLYNRANAYECSEQYAYFGVL